MINTFLHVCGFSSWFHISNLTKNQFLIFIIFRVAHFNIFNISNIFNIFRVAHGKTGSLVLVFMSTSLLSGGFSGNPHLSSWWGWPLWRWWWLLIKAFMKWNFILEIQFNGMKLTKNVSPREPLKDSLNTDDAIEVVARFHQSFTDQRWCNKSQVANQRGSGFWNLNLMQIWGIQLLQWTNLWTFLSYFPKL